MLLVPVQWIVRKTDPDNNRVGRLPEKTETKKRTLAEKGA